MNSVLDKTIFAYALKDKQFAMKLIESTDVAYYHDDVKWLFESLSEHFTDPRFKEIPSINVINEYLNRHYSSQDKFINDSLAFATEAIDKEVDYTEFTWHYNKLKVRYNSVVQREATKSIAKLLKDDPKGSEETVVAVNGIIGKLSIAVDTINRKEAYKEGALNDSVDERMSTYSAVEANPDLARGVFSGFDEFDAITNGLHPGELMLIGGPTSGGKSILMHNMAANAYLGSHSALDLVPEIDRIIHGHNVLYFSLEMPKENQERRIDASMANINYKDIRDGKLDEQDRAKYFSVLNFQKDYAKQFYIVDMPKGATVRDIELKYIEMQQKYETKFDIVFVDYLGIMEPSEKQTSDWLDLGSISAGLHEFARTYSIPVVTAVQLNRSKDPSKQSNTNDRIARSAMITDNANVIIQIGSRGDDEHMRSDMPIYVTKNRDGEKTSFTLIKNFACMQVKNLTDETFGDDDDDDLGI